MKTARTFLFCALALVSLAAQARAQKPAQTTPPPRPANPAAGTLDGSTYTNEYFGLTLTLPPSWVVQGDAAKKEITEGGKKLMGSKDPATDAQIDKAIDSTLNLLTAMQYARETTPPGAFNSGVMCLAEKVPPGSVGVRDEDYIAVLKNTFKFSQLPITLVKDGYTETVGGETFSVMDLTIDVGGAVVRQRYYAHIRRGYALSFILSYQTPEQLAGLTEIIKSVRLR